MVLIIHGHGTFDGRDISSLLMQTKYSSKLNYNTASHVFLYHRTRVCEIPICILFPAKSIQVAN